MTEKARKPSLTGEGFVPSLEGEGSGVRILASMPMGLKPWNANGDDIKMFRAAGDAPPWIAMIDAGVERRSGPNDSLWAQNAVFSTGIHPET
jgi:hypothetical protein